MAGRIDWLYERKSWLTCKKAQEFLGREKIEVAETADARKVRFARTEALRLARAAKKVIAAKGTQVVAFDLAKDAPSDDDLAAVLLGPSGNLRAPALRKGDTLLIGFSPEAYRRVLN